MKRHIVACVLFLVLSVPVLADEPAIGFWVVDVMKLQTAIQDYGTMDEINETGMVMLAECSGHFSGTNIQFRIQSDSLSFDIRGRDNGTLLNYTAVLGWGKIKKSALQFRGTVAVTDEWSFPDEWEMRKHVIVFKRLNLRRNEENSAKDGKSSARELLITQIDCMMLLLSEKKYDLFIENCLEPKSFAAMLKEENLTTAGFAETMELKQYDEATASEFIAGVLALAKENVPEIQADAAAVTVRTGHYVYPSFEFVKEGDTWLWVIWHRGLKEGATSEGEKDGQ